MHYYPSAEGLSQSEFERELYRRRPDLRPARDPFDVSTIRPDDLEDLLPDFLRAIIGRGNADRYHPLVAPLLRNRDTLGDLQQRSGMTTSDFAAAMADSLSVLLISKFAAANAPNDFVRTIPVQNYKSVPLPNISFPNPPELARDDPEFTFAKAAIVEAERSGRLRLFGTKFRFSKPVWSVWGETITESVLNYAAVFASLEQNVLASALAGGTLATTTGGLTLAGFSNAAKTMANELNQAGAKSGLTIKTIIVPPDMIGAAYVLLAAMGDKAGVRVATNPHLSATNVWYAICDPILSAPVVRLILRGNNEPRVYSTRTDADGMAFCIEHAFDYAITTAPGVVKITV